MMKRRHIRIAATMAVALGMAERAHAIAYYDLTSSPNISAQISGGYFFNRGSTNVTDGATGTGTFHTYLALGDGNDANNLVAEGYNGGDSNSTVMPEVDFSKTEFLRVGPGEGLFGNDEILYAPESTSGEGSGIGYYAFGLDVNEVAGAPRKYISLDALEIWVSPTRIADGDTYAALNPNLGATKVYDMDTGAGGNSSVLIDYEVSGSGSGRADLAFLLPQSYITNVPGVNTNWYVYFYTRLGEVGTTLGVGRDYSENGGGFEEWGTLEGFKFFVPALVPEASTWGAIWAVSAAAAAAYLRARRSRSQLS